MTLREVEEKIRDFSKLKDVSPDSAVRIEALIKQVTEYRLKFFKPNPGGQEEFCNSLLSESWLEGPNKSGKTYTGGYKTVCFTLGAKRCRELGFPVLGRLKYAPEPNKGWAVSQTFRQGEEDTEPQVFAAMPPDEISDWSKKKKELRTKGGGILGFMSCEAGWRAFAGPAKRFIWFNEQPIHDVFKECLARRIMGQPLDVFGTHTPQEGIDWLQVDRIEPAEAGLKPDIGVYRIRNLKENIHMDDETRKKLHEEFEGTPDEGPRLHGKATAKSGVVYPMFKRDIHVCERFEVPKSWMNVFCVDPHMRNPTSILVLSIDRDDFVYATEEIVMPTQSLVEEWVDMMCAKIMTRYKFDYGMIDVTGQIQEPTSGMTMRRALREGLKKKGYDISIRAVEDKSRDEDMKATYESLQVKKYKDVSTGEILERPRFKVFSDLPEFLFQIEHLVWDDYEMRRDSKMPKEQWKDSKRGHHILDNWKYLLRRLRFYKSSYVTPTYSGKGKDEVTGY